MANSIRTPKQGTNFNSKRIALAVDNEEWQRFRLTLKGRSTRTKLDMLKAYSDERELYKKVAELDPEDSNDPVFMNERLHAWIRVDNYLKALCRGGQLYPGESLETALAANWVLKVKR